MAAAHSEARQSRVTAGRQLVDTLVALGATRAFCVPGESYLPVLDAFGGRSDIELITCRHESGAGFMAVADAKLTGKPGLCFVSRGPGATNASIAVHTAEQDAVPLVLFIGQVPRAALGRRAFQEIDYGRMFGTIAKRVITVFEAASVAAAVAQAFALALAPTPGPVVVVLPEDVLDEKVAATAVPIASPPPPAMPSEASVAHVADRLHVAERPLLIAGGALGHTEGRHALRAAATAISLPVALSFKRQDQFPNRDPHYAGHLGFKIPQSQVDLYREADVVIAVGTRLGDVTTQGFTVPHPAQTLIHVHANPDVPGANHSWANRLVVDPTKFLEHLADHRLNPSPARIAWRDRVHRYVAERMRWQPPASIGDGLAFGHVVAGLIDRLADDAIVITDAGNFSSWVHRYFPFGERHTLIGAVSGAMGLGVPAAVAAALRCPDRQVVAFVGDGGFLMTGNELATAVKHGLRLCLIVSNNRSYATIRMHQEKQFPGREVATELTNPDFVRLAEAFGALGLSIAQESDVAPVLARALGHDGPVVIDVRTSLHYITAFATLDSLRGPS